jgi:hypothetical protein
LLLRLSRIEAFDVANGNPDTRYRISDLCAGVNDLFVGVLYRIKIGIRLGSAQPEDVRGLRSVHVAAHDAIVAGMAQVCP